MHSEPLVMMAVEARTHAIITYVVVYLVDLVVDRDLISSCGLRQCRRFLSCLHLLLDLESFDLG